MLKAAATIALQTAGIVVVSAGVAVGTNEIRSDGIPLVTDIEYEIFAPCKDSEVESQAADIDDLTSAKQVLYVDARPAEAFDTEHIEGSINIPYSVLFGASDADIEKVRQAVAERKATAVVVYGIYADQADTEQMVDLAKPLAQQLIEAEIKGIKHLEGGLDELKKTGLETVKKTPE